MAGLLIIFRGGGPIWPKPYKKTGPTQLGNPNQESAAAVRPSA